MKCTKAALILVSCGGLALCSQAALSQEKVEKLTLIETPAPEDEKAEIGEMRREIQDMKRRLGEIDSRVQALETTSAPSADAGSPPAPPATPPPTAQWRELKEGMSKDDVRNLLGPPGEIEKGGYNEHWYYPDRGDNSGTVDFGQQGDVLSWTEPQQ